MSYSKQNFRSGDTLYASQLNAMDDEIATLEAEVESTKNMVGSPLTASTAAGMSDQTKIYVYTGNETGYTAGHWYYYNGTAWTDGGVYNSVAVNTDTSLRVYGQAADSKAVGDAIDDLDSDLSDVKSDLTQLDNDKYEKPATGIPASDLASGVIPDVTGKADKVQNATSGNFASLDANGNLTDSGHKHSDYLTEAPVTDVQVDGTSVLGQDGIADVPSATTDNYGVVLIGNGLQISPSTGKLMTNPAISTQVKTGTESFRQITPNVQHQSVFYGLAKAAGDTTQASSSNAVGTYTETAQSKIHEMLDAPVIVSGTTPTITGKAGIRYICGEVSTLSITAPESGCIDVVFTSGSTPTVLTVTSAKTGVTAIKWMNGFDPTLLDANTTYELNILDGELGVAGLWT